jgi:hypothetical protein
MSDPSLQTDPQPAKYAALTDLWRPPGPSLTTRQISRRSTGAARAVLVGGARPRQILCESGLERRCAMLLLARRGIVDVWEQPTPVAYRDAAGNWHHHTFDFLVLLADGTLVAIEVKPYDTVMRKQWRAKIEMVAAHGARNGSGYDGYLLVTERNMPLYAVADAGLILACRRESRPDCDDAVRRAVTGIHGRVTVGDIVDRTGMKGDAFRAVVRLIDDGLLEVVDRGARIDYPTRVRRAADPNGAARW